MSYMILYWITLAIAIANMIHYIMDATFIANQPQRGTVCLVVNCPNLTGMLWQSATKNKDIVWFSCW